MWDLLRYQRQDLHQQELITNEEYALLAEDHPAVKRLESYDEVLDRMTKALAAAQADTEALRAEMRKLAEAWKVVVAETGGFPGGPEIGSVVTRCAQALESLAGRKS